MVCFNPNQAYESQYLNSNGKRKTVYNLRDARAGGLFKRYTPCRICVGCRMDEIRDWTVRIYHEASLYPNNNSFITLTYNDEFLPRVYDDDGSILGLGTLNYDHWRSFMNRFRTYIKRESFMSRYGLPSYSGTIRCYMGPEYGEKNFRPHYHAIIFNYNFPDKTFHKFSNGLPLYRSRLLEDLWSDPATGRSYGFSSVGSATLESMSYVARYNLKKGKGEAGMERYRRFSLETGQEFFLAPEKARPTKKGGGIGTEWFHLCQSTDLYNKDFVTINGKQFRPPKFYDSILEKIDPAKYAAIKESRLCKLQAVSSEYTPERLKQREACLTSLLQQNFKRTLYDNKELQSDFKNV